MSNFLISIGNFPEQALPTVCSALSCGAAKHFPSLEIFHLSSRAVDQSLSSFIRSLSGFHDFLSENRSDIPLFPARFSFSSCTAVLPQHREFSSGGDPSLLLSSLRGRNMPLSYKTDREAVEWAFSYLLTEKANSSLEEFHTFVDRIRDTLSEGGKVRLALLCDISDCFSAAAALVLLPWLRSALSGKGLHIALVALAAPSAPASPSFIPDIKSVIRDLKDRSLVPVNEDESPAGADVMWFVSLPSTLVESNDSHRLVFLSAARIMGRYFASEKLPASGLHTRRITGALSMYNLQDEAVPVASFLLFSSWLLSDLLPAVSSALQHDSHLRPIRLNSRHNLLSRIFEGMPPEEVSASVAGLQEAVRTVLHECISLVQSVPQPLRYSEEMESSWKKAVDTCGRFITVASEYDVARKDMDDSGLGNVRPVHRDSLDDTEEEILVARVGQMADQMNAEKAARDAVLSGIGPFRSFQAKLDCMKRCEAALESACEKIASAPNADDHLTLARRERRVRLLQAAVDRCSSELLSAPDSSSVTPGTVSGPDRYLPVGLSVRGFNALKKYLSHPGDESALRELKDSIPYLIEGCSLPDARSLMKSFQQVCKSDPYDTRDNPFGYMISRAWNVCSLQMSDYRFHSLGDLPEVPLLPDLIPTSPLLTLSGLLSLLHDQAPETDTSDPAELRGLLAMLVLRLYRRRSAGETAVSVSSVSGTAPFLKYWLDAHHAGNVSVYSLLDADSLEVPFLVAVPGRELIPARRNASHAAVIPSFVTWYRAETDSFSDPVPYLSEGDSLLMSAWLSGILSSLPENASGSLKSFIAAFKEDIGSVKPSDKPDKSLGIRLTAVNGLRNLPAYHDSLTKTVSAYENGLGEDRIASGITGNACLSVSCKGFPEEVVYLWRGIPFARENSKSILETAHAADEEYCLKTLTRECTVMSDWSDDYRDQLVRETAAMLARFPDALPECRETASDIIEKAGSPLPDQSPQLEWPWDPLSPSVITVFRECLGDVLSTQLLKPFSEKLAVFPARGGDIIGDSLFSGMCSVLPYASGMAEDPASFSADAVLPPLSPEMVRAIGSFPEARLLLTPDLVKLERPDQSSLRVTMTLNGAFPLRLARTYGEDEIVTLFSNDIPTLAVWPSVPFPRGMWNAYCVYAHLPEGFSVEVPSGETGGFEPMTGDDSRYTAVLQDFPSAFVLLHEGACIGTVPNFLPAPEKELTGPCSVCIDFGSVGTSVVFSSVYGRKPLQGPTMVRTVINNPVSSRDLLRREFLPAVPVSALLPTVSRIFRNIPGAYPVPFADGTVLMSANLQDLLSTPSDALYTCLKWEEEKGRSGYICLHQVMLMAALQARTEGADQLSWRFAIPDEMAHEGRENLRNLFLNLAGKVMQESGFPVPESGLPVFFAAESSALGAYFRLCAPEDTRGGFMVLDIGACTADISLFLRGREQAVRSCQIPLGIHYMLLPTLLRDPLLLKREFGNVTDETFQADLNLLTKVLKDAGQNTVSLRKARLALDHFIADYYPALLSIMNQYRIGRIPTKFGAVLLLHVSYLMMLSGLVLLQIAADPNKNDFLPEQMSLCLSGRGSLILEQMPDDIKSAVWHFLTMFRNRRVASLSLLFSAEKKMEIPVGLSVLQDTWTMLPPASSVPASISVRPEELLPEFLIRFARTFPLSASVLFPDFFTADMYHPFSAAGEAAVSAAIEQSFLERETPRPYNSLAAWIGNLLEYISDPAS